MNGIAEFFYDCDLIEFKINDNIQGLQVADVK